MTRDARVDAYWCHAGGAAVLYHADASDLLARVIAPAVQTVITDPPWYSYGTAQDLARRPFDIKAEVEWLAEVEQFYLSWLPSLARAVDRRAGRAFIFAGPDYAPALARCAKLCGWGVRRLWYAPESNALFLFGRPIPDGAADRIGTAFAASPQFAISDELVLGALLDASEGIVGDPFCGTGTICCAALRRGRQTWGIEARDATCAIAAERLMAEACSLDARLAKAEVE